MVVLVMIYGHSVLACFFPLSCAPAFSHTNKGKTRTAKSVHQPNPIHLLLLWLPWMMHPAIIHSLLFIHSFIAIEMTLTRASKRRRRDGQDRGGTTPRPRLPQSHSAALIQIECNYSYNLSTKNMLQKALTITGAGACARLIKGKKTARETR